jgi:hypothetical protein
MTTTQTPDETFVTKIGTVEVTHDYAGGADVRLRFADHGNVDVGRILKVYATRTKPYGMEYLVSPICGCAHRPFGALEDAAVWMAEHATE